MRVLFVAGEYPPCPGGVGDYTALLGEHLAAQGARVWVLATRAAGASSTGVTVWRDVPRWDWRCAAVALAAVRRARPDVVHVQPAAFGMEPAVSWLPGWLRQRAPGLRTVTTFHDLRVPYLFPKAGRLRTAVRDRLLLGSDAAVFAERADWAAAAPRRPRGRHWIPIGSNLAPSPPAGYDRRRWRAQAGVEDGTFLVVHLGFLNRSKGLETLLDAMVRLHGDGRRARLLLVGAEAGSSDPSNRAYAAELERRLAVLELSGLVRRLPLVVPDIASAYLLAADAAAFPFRDGASLRRGSLLAALAHGLPTVSTEAPRDARLRGGSAGAPAGRGAVAERGRRPFARPHGAVEGPGRRWIFDPDDVQLRDGENLLLVPADDSAALARGLARLADEAVLAVRLATGGRALAEALSWPRIAAAHHGLYELMLGGAPAEPVTVPAITCQ